MSWCSQIWKKTVVYRNILLHLLILLSLLRWSRTLTWRSIALHLISLSSAVGRIALRSNINLCEGLSLTNWFAQSNFVKCPIYSFANHFTIKQLNIITKSLFALVWLVPELMIQYRGYFCWQVFTTETEHIYSEETIPFITFRLYPFISNSSRVLCITKIRFYIHFYVFHPSFENLSTFEQMVLTSPVVLLFGAGDIICKCIKQILITNCYHCWCWDLNTR